MNLVCDGVSIGLLLENLQGIENGAVSFPPEQFPGYMKSQLVLIGHIF